LYFDTIKLVTITNWKFGLLHRSIQVLVLVYIAVYAIWLNQGYQKSSPVDGVLFTKVKGIAFDAAGGVYDSGDLIVPPTESGALFVTTRMLNTVQIENTFCTDPDNANTCATDSDCDFGAVTSNGAVQPLCNSTVSRCVIKGWCPVEVDQPQYFTNFIGLENWTVYMRTHVSYTAFVNAYANNADMTKLLYNIFPLSNILQSENWTDIMFNGAIINVKIDWSCNLDNGLGNCKPTFAFTRIGTGTSSAGFNYRRVIYVPNTGASDIFPQRIYSKFYGVRFIFEITGIGKKFDFASTIVTIGSGAAFFSLATIIVDIIILYLHPQKERFDLAKRTVVDLVDAQEPDVGYVKA